MKFRRKKSEGSEAEPLDGLPDGPAAEEQADPAQPGDALRSEGPWDVSEVDLPEEDPTRVDLGSLVVPRREGLELQLQVDQQSQQVVAVVLADPEGAVELRAFAAPRNGDIWEDVRQQIAAEVSRRGGTASEAEGPWGTELRVVLKVTTPEGQTGTQPSRVFGIPGPRWMLRATFFGRPALEPSETGTIERALRDVVVRRGTQPFAPGEALPLTVPSELLQD
ncbi:MAG TPA: DUF3710 domain-containing protein [Nocardioides sp.]|nr:DUF3710 domain-containing protein [Nocardioides sp.]